MEHEHSNSYESDAEEFDEYGVDGYHPVYIGEGYKNGRYIVKQKLGWGYFFTVWMAYDNLKDRYVALKVQKSKVSYSEAVLDEIKILKSLTDTRDTSEWNETRKKINSSHFRFKFKEHDYFCIKMLDSFPHFRMYEKHDCSTFDLFKI